MFYFLPIFIIVYLLAPRGMKNGALFLGSLFFYAWGEPKYVLLMIAEIAVIYLLGLAVEKFRGKPLAKAAAALAIVGSLCVLGVYKYADFFIGGVNHIVGVEWKPLQLALPIGISFYTFQMISYVVDVYRGTVKAQKNPISLGAYVAMFPQLIAGPIVRYQDIEIGLRERKLSVDKTAKGITRFAVGLGKKVILANSLGEIVALYGAAEEKTVLLSWIYAFAVSLQLYFDFSGYSDMAIGLGHILGFTFPENFDHPFESKSVTEFWRRWHMTLGTWFRDYLYIPMGGNRVGAARHILNILVVWMATGLWHGASMNFVLWGLYFGILLLIEKYFLAGLLKKSKVISHIYLSFLVLISFVLFSDTSLSNVGTTIANLFGIGVKGANAVGWYCLRNYGGVLLAALVGATSLPKLAVTRFFETNLGKLLSGALEILFVLAIFVTCTAFLVNGSYNPFLYFRF